MGQREGGRGELGEGGGSKRRTGGGERAARREEKRERRWERVWSAGGGRAELLLRLSKWVSAGSRGLRVERRRG